MKKFLVLFESSVPAEEQMKAPPEQKKAGMELWMKWMQKAGSSCNAGCRGRAASPTSAARRIS